MKILTKKTMTGFMAALVFMLMAVFVPVASVSAQTTAPAECSTMNITNGINCAKGDGVPENLFVGDGAIFTKVVNIMLFIIGAISVIMLIWGGIRYTTSAGNAAAVTGAKNTIMYAVIGLIVAFLAFAIVNWVLGAVKTV